MKKQYSILFVKIYETRDGDICTVEDSDNNELKKGTMDQHSEFIAWATERAEKVDYDT